MLSIAICDDEKVQINSLKKAVECYLDLKGLKYNIAEFNSGEALINSTFKEYYDIIFLDIEMTGLNGVETARKIRRNQNRSIIIFVTAYPDFVFQGYEVRALNYILKPYKTEKIMQVLYSALEEIDDITNIFYAVELKGGTQKLNLSKTIYFVSDKRKVCAVTDRDKIEFYKKLNELEKELPNFFIRIHQRYLVNINYVTSVESNIAVVNNEVLPVSRTYSHNLIINFAKTMLS